VGKVVKFIVKLCIEVPTYIVYAISAS
jgi:hypothetical protein